MRPLVPEAEELVGLAHPCLDHGSVMLVDYWGGDLAIESAARQSYGRETRSISDTRSLLRYLMRHKHSTPFEMCGLKFQMKLPLFVVAQLVRHRTASINQLSSRYSVMPDEHYIPEPSQIGYQSTTNKQGREGIHLAAERVRDDFEEVQSMADRVYRDLLNFDVARELAGRILPPTLYTEWTYQLNLHNLFHLLGLRLDEHAQYECRVYAQAMAVAARAVAPLCYEAFVDYRLNAMELSGLDLYAMHLVHFEGYSPVAAADLAGMGKSETAEFISKLERIAAKT